MKFRETDSDLRSPKPVGEGDGFHIKKQLTLGDGILLMVGLVIGSGIFISPKGVFMYSGSVGVALVIWVVCGIFSMMGALCMAELGTTITKFGGEYIYLYKIFGPLPGFVYLWIAAIIIKPTVAAIIALTFADYVVHPVSLACDTNTRNTKRLIATLCVLLITYVNIMSVRMSTRLINLFSYAKIITTCAIIVTGFYFIIAGQTDHLTNTFRNPKSAGDIALAMYVGLWSYGGWAGMSTVNEEMTNLQRDLPLSIIISLSLVTVIYILTNIAYFAVLSTQEMLQSNAVAVSFAVSTFGVMSWIVPLFVSLSTFGSECAILFTTARIYFAAAREGQLPSLISMIHIKRRTPVPALLTNGTLTLIMVQVNDIYTLISYVSFMNWFVSLFTVSGLLWYRWRKPDIPRPIKLPVIIPIIFIMITLFLIIVPLYTKPVTTGIGLAITLISIPVYLVTIVHRKKWPTAIPRIIDYITWYLQMILQVYPTDTK